MHALEDEASALAARVGCVSCVLGDVPSQVRRAGKGRLNIHLSICPEHASAAATSASRELL